jgi:AraC-like DNA-binding protein
VALALRQGKPGGLAWDLEHARPGDWSVVQKLRADPRFCQLPLLLYQENVDGHSVGGSRLTDVVLKPAGQQALRHILDLLPPALQCGEIWVVDDDPETLEYFQNLLTNSLADFRVRPILGGAAALPLLAGQAPDLVVLDLMMPEVDGFQVLEHLRRNPKTASTPVIILTGKMLSYEDVKRLDAPKVFLQSKGVLSNDEGLAEVQRVLAAPGALAQPTSLLVKQTLANIHQNYARALSLDELAATVGVSRSYLSRIFKLETGISLWDYLNRFRIQKAKALLLNTDASVTAVAAEVGYQDAGYFGRIFHRVAHCSPRAYRGQSRALNA